MNLDLDTDACQGHGRCYSIAPELFGADEEGHSLLLMGDVSADLETSARHAVESCPEEAIALHE
ncbi:ferredoxin [Mycolicibacterium moriokaense]|uniref:Ferredoxin n=1 Tax=Mycolicibacterium moriokaense TaxID=39691 RepID=A0A318H8H9_9MYCO|nr:ferredoxin [Mycolicibacterium moriokaense]PXX01629.1 ferredoxin [Mycolicibacterium moriokaense]